MRHACCAESCANGIVGDPAPETLTAPSGIRPCTHKSRLASSGWSLSALPPKKEIHSVLNFSLPTFGVLPITMCSAPVLDNSLEIRRLGFLPIAPLARIVTISELMRIWSVPVYE